MKGGEPGDRQGDRRAYVARIRQRLIHDRRRQRLRATLRAQIEDGSLTTEALRAFSTEPAHLLHMLEDAERIRRRRRSSAARKWRRTTTTGPMSTP